MIRMKSNAILMKRLIKTLGSLEREIAVLSERIDELEKSIASK